MNTFIYTLSDPQSKEIFYLGKTSHVKSRLRAHIGSLKSDPGRRADHIKSILLRGQRPIIDVIDEVPLTEWEFWETFWISQLKCWGIVLKNADNGGLSKGRLNKESRDKISKTLTGRTTGRYSSYSQYSLDEKFIRTYVSCKEMSMILKNQHAAPNVGRAYKKYLTAFGFKWIKAGVDPVSYFKKYKIVNEQRDAEYSLAMSKALIGKTLGRKASEETKKKQSLIRLGVSPANKGVKMSEKQRLFMIENNKSKRSIIKKDKNGKIIATYRSVKFASETTKVARASISKCANGKCKYAAGFIWEWETADKDIKTIEIVKAGTF